MNVMTVEIGPEVGGRVVFETVSSLPHKRGKYIAGFARNEDEAKKRAIAYAGGDVEFIRCDGEKVMHNVQSNRRGAASSRSVLLTAGLGLTRWSFIWRQRYFAERTHDRRTDEIADAETDERPNKHNAYPSKAIGSNHRGTKRKLRYCPKYDGSHPRAKCISRECSGAGRAAKSLLQFCPFERTMTFWAVSGHSN